MAGHETSSARPTAPADWGSELFVVSAESVETLGGRLRQIADRLTARPSFALEDLACTVNAEGVAGPVRLAVVAHSPDDLANKLAHAGRLLAEPGRDRIKDARGIYFFRDPLGLGGRVAFLFPGEGSQYQHMLADLRDTFPQVRSAFELADRIGPRDEGWVAPTAYIFPPPDLPEDERAALEQRLWRITEIPAVVMLPAYALLRLLEDLGLRADAIAGHSAGEYTALAACGAYGPVTDEGIAAFMADLRGTYEDVSKTAAGGGAALFAVAASAREVSETLAGTGLAVHVAMDNCPHQCIAVVSAEGAEQAMAALAREGLICQRLPFDMPYHTALFEDYALSFESFFRQWIVCLPRVPLYSCAIAAKVPEDLEEFRRLACRQWMMPVRFRETVDAMYEDGVRIFVEVGPRGSLTAFVDEVLKGRPHLAVASNVRSRPGITQLHHMLGLLAAHHVPVDLAPLYEGRAARPVDLGGDREQAMASHFERMTRLLADEREAMRAYFSGRAPGDAGNGAD
jgi:acyl transferase domain-containing protein